MEKLSISPEREEVKKTFSQEQVNQIAAGLIDGTVKVENVPSYIHSRLFVPLSLAKSEAKIGNLEEKYQRINDIIWSLNFSLIKPDKTQMPQFSSPPVTARSFDPEDHLRDTDFLEQLAVTEGRPPTIPLITAVIKSGDTSYTERRLRGEYSELKLYYETEMKRLHDLQESEYKKLMKKHEKTRIPANVNEAKRVRDGFELELVSFRSKWQKLISDLEKKKDEEYQRVKNDMFYVTGFEYNPLDNEDEQSSHDYSTQTRNFSHTTQPKSPKRPPGTGRKTLTIKNV